MPETYDHERKIVVVREEVLCVACHWRGFGQWLSEHMLRDHDCPGCGKVATLVCTGQSSGLLALVDDWHPLGHRIITPREGLG